jgi:hypothetical protein
MSTERLLQIASPPLSASSPAREACPDTQLGEQLWKVLSRRNGFYALESALHVYPAADSRHPPLAWLNAYEDLTAGLHFFGEDIFGNQFVLRGDRVALFDAETGVIEEVARSLEEWAERLLSDDYWTGWSLAHQWQMQNGPLEPGHRLLPKLPFVLGGQFTAENLYSVAAAEGMNYRAGIALQIRGVPDGADITLKISP